MNTDPRLQQLIRFFEQIDVANVSRLDEVYTPDAFFKDPFNEVKGIEPITRIFRHMFDQVDSPRFVVTDSVIQGDQAFLTWDFLFRMKRFSSDEQCIRGATHVRFASDGRVNFHRDYWDAAEELYEKLPLLGSLMRALKRMANR
jgi:steroid Delta-isomerase